MAVGCTHGELAHAGIQEQVLKFCKAFKPEIRMDLGDVLDTAAFRRGAKGTPDEARDPAPDYWAAVRWIERYEPTHIAWGNHDVRLLDLAESPNGIIAHAASSLWHSLQDTAAKIKAKTVPYDFEKGWFELGGTFWGHGYWYNEQALRDHAEYLGGPVVMAHIHTPQELVGRTRRPSKSYCVGTLADIDKLSYARRRRATSRWGHGLVFGEISDTESRLWLASCPKGEKLHFPFPI
jgi:hypothetical protein